MRVTIGQINTINGNYAANAAAIIKGIEQAKRDQSDLVVFPEVAVQGYTSLDWFLDRDVVLRVEAFGRSSPQLKDDCDCWNGTTSSSPRQKTVLPAAVIRDRGLLGLRQDSAPGIRRVRRSALLRAGA
jgi:NAD+ synthase (glutamine-hydrolysing)